jgi:hypothetical protein
VSPWKVILATMVIFGCGVLTGALVITTVNHNHAPPADPGRRAGGKSDFSPLQIQRVEFLRRMDKQLNLTADQRERIGKIMRSSQDRTKPLWDVIAPQMRKELKRTEDEIRHELTADQEKKFAELLKPHSHRSEGQAPAQMALPANNSPGTNSP